MYALEMPATVDDRQQIHLQLPAHISAKHVRVLIMYDNKPQPATLIDALMQMPNVGNDADFARVNPSATEEKDVFN